MQNPSELLYTRKKMYNFQSSVNADGVVEFFYHSINRYTVNELYDILVKQIAKNLTMHGLRIQEMDCVLTVPAYFDNCRRDIIRNIYKSNMFNVTRFVNEPTSVLMNYFNVKTSGSFDKVLIVDIGGSTMDFTIATINNMFIRINGTSGDIDTGGNILTDSIYNYITSLYTFQKNVNVWMLSESIKIELSRKTEVRFDTNDGERVICRVIFEGMIRHILEKCVNMINTIIGNVRFTRDDITHVIYSGGSSCVPIIRRTISNLFKHALIIDYGRDEFAVCNGVQVMVNFRADNNITLIDVIPMHVGVVLSTGEITKMLSSNTCIPTTVTKDFKILNYKKTRKMAVVNIVEYNDNDDTMIFLFKMIVFCKYGDTISIKINVDINGMFTVYALQKEKVIRVERLNIVNQNTLHHLKPTYKKK